MGGGGEDSDFQVGDDSHLDIDQVLSETQPSSNDLYFSQSFSNAYVLAPSPMQHSLPQSIGSFPRPLTHPSFHRGPFIDGTPIRLHEHALSYSEQGFDGDDEYNGHM